VFWLLLVGCGDKRAKVDKLIMAISAMDNMEACLMGNA
jgi:hypothetical protein